MDKTYQPHAIETSWYQTWEQNNYFAPQGSGEPYTIALPPPNVTGSLHMGHGFNNSVMDALIRFRRMQGRNTLWQPGTDHAGIATQMVVERQLAAQDVSRHDLGREKFLEKVWEWKEQSGGTITSQIRRLGSSVDWTRERFTMDEGLSEAVKEAFVRLYEDGLIYRGKRLVNWDPKLHTAISDLEVENHDETGSLWHLRYPLADGATTADGKNYLIVATTRPETMLGDTAVAVNPEDERYKALIGKFVELPLVGRRIPIVGDDYCDPEFGTGCVKITPAHDFNDYEVGQRHDLPLINVFDENAALNEQAPPAYRGLDRFAARERIVEDMRAQGLLDGIDDHVSMIPRGDRSGAVVEPFLTDQWYVRVKPLAEPAIEAVEQGRVRFVPENWSKTYFDWMHNIQDWCISRQLWWGHRIPAWYDDAGRIYVGRDEADARAKNDLPADLPLRQDEDVLDTWFSSALWPFSTLGWPERTAALETWYPTNVLVTGFDIIFFWVARMIMMGLKFMGDVPFREVYIHGLVRDQEGQKMSKSKGNILDPLDVVDGIDLESLVAKRTEGLMQPHLKSRIEKTTRKEFPDGIPAFGADALRLTFASLATTGRDIRFDLGRVDGYHRFCNKLWNASGYVLTHLAQGVPAGERKPTIADRWIRSRLGRAVRAAHEAVSAYRFDLMTQALYDFAWHEFCDWYLELTKPVLQADDADPREVASTRATLAETLDALLKLLHPLIPFVTEELWLKLAAAMGTKGDTIMLEPLPRPEVYVVDDEAEQEIDWLQRFVVAIRQIRGEMNIAPSHRLAVKLAGASAVDRERVARHRNYLERLAVLAEISEVESASSVRGAATALVGDMQILVPLAGLIDIAAERERLGKQLERASADLEKCRRKLANEAFVANAPPDVVAKERERAAELEQRAARLERQIALLTEIE